MQPPVPLAGCWPRRNVQADGRHEEGLPQPYTPSRESTSGRNRTRARIFQYGTVQNVWRYGHGMLFPTQKKKGVILRLDCLCGSTVEVEASLPSPDVQLRARGKVVRVLPQAYGIFVVAIAFERPLKLGRRGLDSGSEGKRVPQNTQRTRPTTTHVWTLDTGGTHGAASRDLNSSKRKIEVLYSLQGMSGRAAELPCEPNATLDSRRTTTIRNGCDESNGEKAAHLLAWFGL
jgi:hypothetical protein